MTNLKHHITLAAGNKQHTFTYTGLTESEARAQFHLDAIEWSAENVTQAVIDRGDVAVQAVTVPWYGDEVA